MMQKDLSSLQQQQRLATLYAMQQQQQQGRLPPQSFGQTPNSMYSNPAASMLNNQGFRPQQQQPQGMFMRPHSMAQGNQVMGSGGLPPKFASPLQQHPMNYQQQQQQQLQLQQLQQQQFQLQQQHQLRMQQQRQHLQPTPMSQLPGRPAMVPAATTPPVMMGMSGAGGMPAPLATATTTAAPPGASSTLPPPPPPIEAIAAETPAQKENLAQYQQRDRAYQGILNDQHKRHLLLAQEKKREIETSQHERKVRMQGPNGVVTTFGPGYRGLGNGTTGVQSKLIYPRDKKRLRRTPLLKFSLDDMKEQSTKEDSLVPIRLEFEADGYKVRDTFTWNLNEQLVTPEQFAEQMCEDLRLPPASFIPQITRSIKDQVQDYYLHASSMVTNDASDTEENPKSPVSSHHNTLSTQPTPIKREHSSQSILDDSDQDVKKKPKRHAELRMLIKLDITVGHKALIDQFEWDINCPENSPEQFAEILANDLGLGGEFRTAIAHSIREQVHVYTKSLLLVGHEFDGPVVDDDLKHSFLPYVKSVIRDADAVNRFTPAILELSDAELQKNEKDRLREARRKRRQTRGRRGIILPDREPLKTNRTTHETQPDQEMTDEQFFASVNGVGGAAGGAGGLANGIRGSTPAQEAMHSQRRSALRARANIAAEAAGPSPGFMHTTF